MGSRRCAIVEWVRERFVDGAEVTRLVYEKLKDEFVFEARGEIEIKGKGSVEAWLLKM